MGTSGCQIWARDRAQRVTGSGVPQSKPSGPGKGNPPSDLQGQCLPTRVGIRSRVIYVVDLVLKSKRPSVGGSINRTRPSLQDGGQTILRNTPSWGGGCRPLDTLLYPAAINKDRTVPWACDGGTCVVHMTWITCERWKGMLFIIAQRRDYHIVMITIRPNEY